jgi:HPt (histidine-containing phosphotransfer) domain-containing protein
MDRADQLPILDLSEFDEICDGDEPLRERLVTMFGDQARTAIIELTAAITAGDAAAIERTAHALKGSAAILGARRLAAIAHELYECAVDNQLAQAPRQLSLLSHVYDLTSVAMAADLAGAPLRSSTAA